MQVDQRTGIEKSIVQIQNGLTETRLTITSSRSRGQAAGLEVSGIIWRVFMSAPQKAAVHLGLDSENNLLISLDTDFEQFDISDKFDHGPRK